MKNTFPFINELVSLAVLLLMVTALVASEADAKMHEAARAAAAATQQAVSENTNLPFRTTINTRIGGQSLTISIDAVAQFSRLPFADQ